MKSPDAIHAHMLLDSGQDGYVHRFHALYLYQDILGQWKCQLTHLTLKSKMYFIGTDNLIFVIKSNYPSKQQGTPPCPFPAFTLCRKQWPCNTPSENSLKSKTNTRTGKTVLRLVKIQSLRKIPLTSRTL
jgi:hypothetical protein